MTSIDVAYAAGLYEGEGWVCYQNNGGLSARISMTDKDPLTKMHSLVYGSTLRGPRSIKNRINDSPLWTWGVYGKNAVSFLRKIRPFLGRRRLNQINIVLTKYKQKKQTLTAEGEEGPSDQQVPPLANQCLQKTLAHEN